MHNNRECPLCKGQHFTWGEIREGQRVSFTEGGFWASMGFNREQISARRCNKCGNIQLFASVPFSARQNARSKELEKQKRDHRLAESDDDYFE